VASTYVNNLRLEEMTTGEKSGTWGNITNTNLQLVGQALGYGTRAIANASTDNITIADGASDADRSMYLKLTGGGQACTVTLLPNTSSKMWIMENATSYTLTFTQGSGANVAILAGQTKMIFADGLGAGAVVYELGTIAVQNLSVTGVTSNADGSAAAPSLSFNDDIDTGFYRAGANSIGVVLGGTEELTLNSTKASALDALGSVMSSTATAAAQRAALGLDTGDTPDFTGITIGGGADALNYYDVGSFTPAVLLGATDITTAVQAGQFIRFGPYVFFYLIVTVNRGTTTGGVTITGLPFTSGGTNGPCSLLGYDNVDPYNSGFLAAFKVGDSGTILNGYSQAKSGSWALTGLNGNTFFQASSSATFNLSGFYKVA
jgi:hypothetical protein